jgi:hypothetical protein
VGQLGTCIGQSLQKNKGSIDPIWPSKKLGSIQEKNRSTLNKTQVENTLTLFFFEKKVQTRLLLFFLKKLGQTTLILPIQGLGPSKLLSYVLKLW